MLCLSHLDRVDRLDEPKCLHVYDLTSKKDDLARLVILLAEPHFVFQVNGSSCSVVGTSMIRCLAQGSSGRPSDPSSRDNVST